MQVLKLLSDNTSQNATLKQLNNFIGPTQTGAATPRPSFSSPIGDVDMSHTSFFTDLVGKLFRLPKWAITHHLKFTGKRTQQEKQRKGLLVADPQKRKPMVAFLARRVHCKAHLIYSVHSIIQKLTLHTLVSETHSTLSKKGGEKETHSTQSRLDIGRLRWPKKETYSRI